MSSLKNRIRLQQAQTSLERGLISQETFNQIELECSPVLIGVVGQIIGSTVEGTQLGPADLPSAITATKAKKPRATATPKAAKASTPVPVVTAEATPNEGNA
ncbi:hypothetical protein [Spirosoma oryzicola]|uniref:hypothetical protein n=1 Tax=Spirosoma oryzicola TaxID=2898794 RepID=UPI001E3DA165|nr:hypothetical protein [Spirosoma oryzicola]UHG93314.1 hypothetical protein LQ777_10520 [Spirosoma oryzicola]